MEIEDRDMPADFLLAEYNSLRAEIAAHQATRSRYLGLALTATGAVGTFALGKDGNREILLVLPLVLSGLAIVYLKHTIDIENLGRYLREELWPVIRDAIPHYPAKPTTDTPEPSAKSLLAWDDWIQQHRAALGRLTPYGSLGLLPPLLIFSTPSLGGLLLAIPPARAGGWWLAWALDIITLVIAAFLTLWVFIIGPGWKSATTSQPVNRVIAEKPRRSDAVGSPVMGQVSPRTRRRRRRRLDTETEGEESSAVPTLEGSSRGGKSPIGH